MSPPPKSKKTRRHRRKSHQQVQRQAEVSQRAELERLERREHAEDLDAISTKQVVANIIHYVREKGAELVEGIENNNKLDELEIVAQMTKVSLKQVQEIDAENIVPHEVNIKKVSCPQEPPREPPSRARVHDDDDTMILADLFLMIYFGPVGSARRSSGRRYSSGGGGTTSRALGYPGYD